MNAKTSRLIRRNAETTNALLDADRPETHVSLREEYAAWNAMNAAERAHEYKRLGRETAEIEAYAAKSPGKAMQVLRAQGEIRATQRAAKRKPNQAGMRAMRRSGMVRFGKRPLWARTPKQIAAANLKRKAAESVVESESGGAT